MVELASTSTSAYFWAWSRNLRAAAALPSHSGGRAAFVNISAGCDCCRKRMSTASPAIEEKADPPASDVVVQYVVLQRDLIDAWPMGSVVTQGCHASVAAIWFHKDNPIAL